MANRYQNRPFPGDDAYGQDAQSRGRAESDPLAELARLIGQTDPFAASGREAPRRATPEPAPRDEPDHAPDVAPKGPPAWMQRVAAHEAQQQAYQPAPAPHDTSYDAQHDHQADAYGSHAAHEDYPAENYPAEPYQAEPYRAENYQPHDSYAGQAPLDPDRYDHALYGQADDAHQQAYAPQEAYAEDPYAYQDGYAEPEEAPRRRGGMATVAIVLALAVVGTGGAYAYRTFMGSSRSGEPPVIKADPGPNKIIPPSSTASSEGGKAIQDRIGGNAPERLVSREETPVNVQDATKAGGPRVVFPPLNQNANPPTTASVSPAKPMVGNGAVQGDEPRKIRTVAVRGDQGDAAATPAARQAPARITAPAPAPAAAPANAPLSLSPQSPAAPSPRVASTNPAQAAPAGATGGYVVQVSSQRTESDAQASFRALQGKFPAVLGSRTPLIKRADLGDKGTYYRAMVGPFGSPDEAAQFCGNLKTAGGQCVVQRN